MVSHIPILSLTAITFAKPRGREHLGTDTIIDKSEMHTDGPELHRLFTQNGAVRLCASGHIHLLDRCLLDDITYVCDGAVCGAWWKGPSQGVPEGYDLLDLFDDGSVEHSYMTYGWKATAAASYAAPSEHPVFLSSRG